MIPIQHKCVSEIYSKSDRNPLYCINFIIFRLTFNASSIQLIISFKYLLHKDLVFLILRTSLWRTSVLHCYSHITKNTPVNPLIANYEITRRLHSLPGYQVTSYLVLLHNWRLPTFSQDYGLASHIIHVVCINFIRQ